MRQESNHRMNSSGKGNMAISNSRAMGVIILIALLFVFQVVTFTVHKIRERICRTAELSAVGDGYAAEVSGAAAAGDGGAVGKSGERAGRRHERFRFNPNTVGQDSLQRLGFTPRQAQSILNYRSKGGKFRRKEDFARLYVVDSIMYASLEEYIAVPAAESASPASKRATDNGSGVRNVRAGTRRIADDGLGPDGALHDSMRAAESNIGKSTDALYGRRGDGNRFICNLNTADSTELVRLYGIGGYYARKILDYRERLGGSFVSARQLLEIEGFTPERFSGIEKYIEVKEEDVKGFSILDAERKALERHPYIGAYAARGILMYLEHKGRKRFKDNLQLLEQLVREHIISENNALRLREYLLHL